MREGERKYVHPVTQMTFEQYDSLLSIFDQMSSETFYPNVQQLDKMKENPGRWILFACYLLEKGKPPKNKAEEYGKRNLIDFVNKYFELVDSEEEITNPPNLKEMRSVRN